MKVLRVLYPFSLIGLLCFSLTNGSPLENECAGTAHDNANRIVENITNQLQLDLFFTKRMVTQDNHTETCVQLQLTGNEFTLDIIQLMWINATKLIVKGNGTDIDCTANATGDLDTLKNMVQPITGTSLVLFDGLAFSKCPVPILIEEVDEVMISNCVFM